MPARGIAPSLAYALLTAGTLDAQPARATPGRPDTDSLPGRVVDVAAGEFFFAARDTIAAGLTTFRLRQTGLVHHRVAAGGAAFDSGAADRGDQTRGFHMLWVVRLGEGRTMADFYRAVEAGEPTPWARNLGGPAFIMPPRTTNATLQLEPGNYVLACYVGSARADRARYHLLNGMFRQLTVIPSRTPGAPLAEPHVVMRISETGAIRISGTPRAGRTMIRVENAGEKPYEFIFRRVLPGHTTAEALAWRLANAPTTTRPFEPWGGLSDVPSRGWLVTTMTFEPGDYFVGGAERVAFTVSR